MDWLNGWVDITWLRIACKRKGTAWWRNEWKERWTTQFKDIGIFPQENSDQVLFQAELYVCACMLM